MRPLTDRLGLPVDRPPRCLALGAHPDDIEIGLAGTLLRLRTERPDAELCLVVLTGAGTGREDEARASAEGLWPGARLEVLDGLDGHLPYREPGRIKTAIAGFVEPPPDLVFTHRADDAHQDHRFAGDVAWQLFRHSTILGYEVPKWDGDLGPMNLFVPLTAGEADAKVAHLMGAFPSQHGRDWYDPDTFRGLLRIRGMESRAPSGFAEAFVARKLVL